MPDALWWVLAALLAMAGVFLVGILCTPVRVGVAFDTGGKALFGFKLAVFGGYLPLVNTIGKPPDDRAQPKDRAKEKTKDASVKRRQAGGANVASRAPRMLRAAPRLISRIIAHVKIEALDADMAVGLPDPADTGIVFGMLAPLSRLASSAKNFHITLRPEFNDARFDGCGRAAARFTPIALIPPAFGFGWAVFVAPRLSGVFR